MLLDVVTKGTTDYSCMLRIVDSSDGTPETGVAYDTAGIDLWYKRPGSVHSSITEATLASESAAHSDGGFVHVSDGNYRLDLPDAAVATGVDYVDVGGTVTGMVVIGGRIRLTDVDLSDGVRGGMTALPNAAADAAGGLIISDGGGLDADAMAASVTAVETDTDTTIPGLIATAQADLDIITGADGVNLLSATQASIDAIETDTGTTLQGELDAIQAAVITNAAGADIAADIIAVKSETAAILVDTGTTLQAELDAIQAAVITNAAGADIAADIIAVKAETAAILVDTGTTLQAELDAIQAAVITNAAGADIAADIIAVKADTAAVLADTADMQPKLGTPAADISADIAAVKVDTAATLIDTAEIGTAGAGLTAIPGLTMQSTTIATLASQTSFTLTAGSADDDAYKDCVIVVTDQSTATQKCFGVIADYTGSTRTVTLGYDPSIFTMATGDTVHILPPSSLEKGPKKGVAFNNVIFKMVDNQDHSTAETGLTPTCQISLDGGSLSACTNSATEIGNGLYKINLTAAETAADLILLRFTDATSDPFELVFTTET